MTVDRKLQLKFILTTMIAIVVIVIGVFGVVTFENYKMTNEQLDALLDFISENDGHMIDPVNKKYEYLADEAKYSTRYFTIRVDSERKYNKGRFRKYCYCNLKRSKRNFYRSIKK